MNRMPLAFTSLLIALFFHLAILNIFVFVIPIDPEAQTPKFFFLGPILTQNDVSRNKLASDLEPPGYNLKKTANSQENFYHKPIDPEKNPFTIGAIKKPIVSESPISWDKMVMKSTSEAITETEVGVENVIRDKTEVDLNIRPYQPLQFRSP